MAHREPEDMYEYMTLEMGCCDGTGWTGDPRVICTEHYESNTLAEFR